MKNQLKNIKLLFILIAVIWLIFGLETYLSSGNFLFTALMFINSGLFFWLGKKVCQREVIYYYGALIILAINIVLTITDQFGVYDFIILFLNIYLFWLLIKNRHYI
ncbi:MAG: hypothetical protein WC323_03015 [Patescibacteria group bacterium]|jgi:hypothetical protein